MGKISQIQILKRAGQMELTSISVTKMHGFIDASIKLNKDIAIIVGVNGAGKTSLLNLTANLLRFNMTDLMSIEFEKFILKGKVRSASFELACHQQNQNLEIKLKRKNKIIETLDLKIPRWEEPVYQDRAAKYAYDRLMRHIYDQISGSMIAAFVQEHVKLTLVRLDRTLFAEDTEGTIAVDAAYTLRRQHQDGSDPISRVDMVTKDRYNKYRVDARRYHEELTIQIVSLIFQVPNNFFSNKPSGVKFTGSQLEALREKLTKVLNLGSGQELSTKINDYFSVAAKSIESPSVDPSPDAATRQMTQILFRNLEYPRLRGLFSAFEKYDKEVARSFAQLEVFRTQINDFLADSNKEVFFSEAESSLRFRLKGMSDSVGRPISELSSGEKQIVIMLTYLAFLAGKDSIFIVDEPELSLHLAWQRKLIESLSKLRPPSSQLILATHSPEIVSHYRSAVGKLSPAYTEA